MKGFISSAAVAAVLLASSGVDAFAPASRGAAVIISSSTSPSDHVNYHQTLPSTHAAAGRAPFHLSATKNNEDNIDAENSNHDDDANTSYSRRAAFLSKIQRKSKPITLAILTASSTFLPGSQTFLRSPILPAKASAPIVLKAAKQKDDPPMVQALKKAEEVKKQKSLEEFDNFMAKANDIEISQGKAARDAYEKQYHLDKEAAEVQKKIDIEKLKRKLLDGGQDPNTDLDAERQVFLLEHDVDLEKIMGTPQNELMIKNFQSRGRKAKGKGGKGGGGDGGEDMYQKNQRYIIACQVADLKARGINPLEHFSQKDVMDKTRAIYKMDDRVAEKVAKQYEGLMEQYGGRLTAPKEGEVPFVYPEVGDSAASTDGTAGTTGSSAKEERAAAKAQRAAEKEAARKERADAKAAAKAERAAAKEQARADRAAAKEAKLAEKAAGAAAALAVKEGAAAAAAAAASVTTSMADDDVAATANGDVFATAGNNAVAESSIEQTTPTSTTTTQQTRKTEGGGNEIISKIKSYATPKNAIAVVVGGGVVKYGLDYYVENNAGAQSERERQLKLILGDEDDEDDEDEFDDDEDEDEYEQFMKKKLEPPTSTPKIEEDKPEASKPTPPPLAPPVPAPPAPKPKRKLGIFSKRNANARETDINVLVGPNAQAPEFASLLAKILTFGAPGRFPTIASWGNMPFDTFDLNTAKSLLTESRTNADLTDEQSAEIFASVVNCMIIDIVDLASATLRGKKKDEKVTVDAINVVMDFMDHAASLFDAVAEDVTIKPVTYGGSLRKKDLEQMFSVYAGSSMMSLDALAGGGTSQDRVDTLQLVFAITDKKAEGLMQKHMMKMMMNLMKDGGKGLEGMPGMEGMEDMMKAMGGADGMGLPGMGMDGEMSPEDLKQTLGMMKELMDSGQVSEEELVEVRKQFKEMYGSDISDLIKKATEEGAGQGMSEDEQELLDMFKRILGED